MIYIGFLVALLYILNLDKIIEDIKTRYQQGYLNVKALLLFKGELYLFKISRYIISCSKVRGSESLLYNIFYYN